MGRQATAGEAFGEIESVKAVSDMYSPVDGEVVAVNSGLADQLETIGEDPYTAHRRVGGKWNTPDRCAYAVRGLHANTIWRPYRSILLEGSTPERSVVEWL